MWYFYLCINKLLYNWRVHNLPLHSIRNIYFILYCFKNHYLLCCSLVSMELKLSIFFKIFLIFPWSWFDNSCMCTIVDSRWLIFCYWLAKQTTLLEGCKHALDNNHLPIWGDFRRFEKDFYYRVGNRKMYYGHLRLQVELKVRRLFVLCVPYY